MNYHDIKKIDMLNGSGLRVILFVSGCSHYCEDCQNSITWDANGGILFDKNAMQEIKDELKNNWCAGITFSGGDPLYPRNRKKIKEIISEIKKDYPDKNMWLYTGYKYEDLLEESKDDIYLKYIINNIDILIDGEFEKDKLSPDKHWVGSSNQRIIDMKKTLDSETIIELEC